MKMPELLAPAGSPAAFRAAVAAGADAIYLSGKQFGARKFAPNFTDDEMEEAIGFAHARGVRVYVTVNTLIHDREMAGAAAYLIRLWSIGADAVLIQDAGLALFARKIVPDLRIHASTQLTIHNTGGVRWAAEHGFTRVVLSRELALPEIKALADCARETGIGLEIFAHGALCYCYSGQCLLSSVIGGRSGNRGACAQPCRKSYTFVTGKTDEYGKPVNLKEAKASGNYLISPRDLCTYRHLDKIVHAPLASLKIEGRMKSPEYVAIVVSTYRRALDAIAAGTWKPSGEDERDLYLAFNRGFTKGYLLGSRGESLMGRDAPDNRGLCIGKVTHFDERKKAVTVRLNSAFVPGTGDGLFIKTPATDSHGLGFSLNNTPVLSGPESVTFLVPGPAAKGAEVSITSSRALENRAHHIMTHNGLAHPVLITVNAKGLPDGSFHITGSLTDTRGNPLEVDHSVKSLFIPARPPRQGLTADQLRSQLEKTGGTPFELKDLTVDVSEGLFASQSLINKARRDFLETVKERLVSSLKPSPIAVKDAHIRLEQIFTKTGRPRAGRKKYLPELGVYVDSAKNIAPIIDAGCTAVIFEPGFNSSCGKEVPVLSEVLAAQAACDKANIRFVWKLPRITNDRALSELIPLLKEATCNNVHTCMVENIGSAKTIRDEIPKLELTGGIGLNIFNAGAVEMVRTLLSSVTLSQELSGAEIRELVTAIRKDAEHPGISLMVQGSAESMISEDCLADALPAAQEKPFTGVRDATGRIFPVYTDTKCRTHILNAVETCLVDYLPELISAGIDEIAIDARGRTAAYAGEMTRLYREALTACGIEAERIPSYIRDDIRKISLGGITAGHYTRGVKESQT